jgi:hypothetical protein
MGDAFGRYEVGNTKQFHVTYSAAPTTPHFDVWAGSGMATLVASEQAQSSSSTAFYAFFTMPDSEGMPHAFTFTASFTGGPVVDRGNFVPVQTNKA